MDYAKLMTSSWEFTKEHKAVALLGSLVLLSVYLFRLDWLTIYMGVPYTRLPSQLVFIIVLLIIYLAVYTFALWGKASIILIVLHLDQQDSSAKVINDIEAESVTSSAKKFLKHARPHVPQLLRLYAIWIGGAVAVYVLQSLFTLAMQPEDVAKQYAFILSWLILLLPLTFIAIKVWDQSIAAMVIEDLSPITAIRRGWQIVMDNLGAYIAVSLILALFNIVIRILLFGVRYLFNNPFPPLINVLLFVSSIPILLIVLSAFTGFTSVVWTRVFLQLTQSD